MAEIYNPGYDTSGNENDWTPVNINYTTSTATTYDRVSDVPTLTDEDTGNFATLNVINKPSSHTLSNGNLTTAITSIGGIDSTIGVSSGKWYCEVTLTTVGADTQLGVTNLTNGFVTAYLGQYTTSWGCITFNGNRIHNGSQSAYGSSFSNGDVGMIALDMDTGKWYCGKNGTWFDSGDPANGTNPAHTGLTGVMKFAIGSNSSSGNHSINFGQRPFAYTPPTGFKKLNTYNLPDSAIKDGSKYMNPVLYTGNGGTNAISGFGFQPDLIWWKNRTNAAGHNLMDNVRGLNKYLNSNLTNAEGTGTAISSIDSDGYTINSSGSGTNATGDSYVTWAWLADNTSGSSNTDGTITSTVSANTTSGFSVVTYTGNGVLSTIGHGLSSAPDMIITKRRDAVDGWFTYHSALGKDEYLNLSSTSASDTTLSNYWGTSEPTSTVYGVNTYGGTNTNGGSFVSYCFAEVEGFSKFGSYTGNGSTDGPFVYTGFKPAFVIIKKTSATDSWVMHDTSRSSYNQMESVLYSELSNAESTTTAYGIDCVSNGFKIRETGDDVNTSGATFIYMAFASNPLKHSLAR